MNSVYTGLAISRQFPASRPPDLTARNGWPAPQVPGNFTPMNTCFSFRITALPRSEFAPLFGLAERELARRGVRRVLVDSKPGFPCRISLADAEPGENVILLPFTHHAVDSPYRASGPIFVREQAMEAVLSAGEVPEAVRRRLLSVRAYDRDGMMIDGEVTRGGELEACIEKFFADPRVDRLHLHNAKPGCYLCAVERISG